MKFANMTNVDNAARFIAGELTTILDRMNVNSHMSRRIREACPEYHKLTNTEGALARMLALGLAQRDAARDLCELTIADERDEEAA